MKVILFCLAAIAASAAPNPQMFEIDVTINIKDDGASHDRVKSSAKYTPAATSSSAVPIATLPYELHHAQPLKTPDQPYYVFSNVPYAKQPVGSLRFKEAEALSKDYLKDPPVNKGEKDVVCPQEQVGWFPFAKEFSTNYFDVSKLLDPKWKKKITPEDYEPLNKIRSIPNQSEECLVLDVYVPRKLWDANQDVWPVTVFFHGGGFIFGSKTIHGTPDGLLNATAFLGNGSDYGSIFVSVNYRLGAFGWLAGPNFTDAGGFPNAGLSDQATALNWVKDNIYAFGGDPHSVTVMGESAGASSILHHITAWGGPRNLRGGYKPRPPFRQAILQSPAFVPSADYEGKDLNAIYQRFREAAGATDFEELQKKSSADLIEANRKTIYTSPYGLFTYGPVSDTAYVPYPPSMMLLYRFHWTDLSIMVANNRREGMLFTPPWIRNNDELESHIREIYPRMDNESLAEMRKLYPVGDWVDPKKRLLQVAAPFGDLANDCNVLYLRRGITTTFEYFYNLYPGFHGQDIGATFWPTADSALLELNNEVQAQRLQRYLGEFMLSGTPSADTKFDPEFDPWYMDQKAMWLGDGEIHLKDPDTSANLQGDPLVADERCQFWSYAPYLGGGDEQVRAHVLEDQFRLVENEL